MTQAMIPIPRTAAGPNADVPIVPHAGEIRADRNFRVVLSVSGSLTLLILASIGAFLLWKGYPTIQKVGFGFITSATWNPTVENSVWARCSWAR